MIGSLLAAGAGFVAGDGGPRSSDWITTGADCSRFAAGDVDGDGFDDLLTINGARELCVSFNVHGWKASAWRGLLEVTPEVRGMAVLAARAEPGKATEPPETIVWTNAAVAVHAWSGAELVLVRTLMPPEGRALAEGEVQNGELVIRTGRTSSVRLGRGWDRLFEGGALERARPKAKGDPPPYEQVQGRLHVPIEAFAADIDGDRTPDLVEVYACERPHAHRALCVTLAGDEARTGFESSFDADRDGLTDEREMALGTDRLDRDTDDDGLLDGWEVHGLPRGVALSEGKLDPRHQDVIVAISRYEELDEQGARSELGRAKRLFGELDSTNPDGERGIRLHYHWLPAVPKERQGNWPAVGERELPPNARGLMHWMQVTPGSGGQSQQGGDQGGSGLNRAAFAHELGHQLGLSHTGDSKPAWCPLYPSLMNYAFNYSIGGSETAIRFSNGRFRGVELRETELHERLPFRIEELWYLTTAPYHFVLKAESEESTLVDWNHDGVFAPAPVRADVNYGGSTYCGVRRDVDLTGCAPALGRLGDTILLARTDHARFSVLVQEYEGGERWSQPIALEASGPVSDLVVAGGGRDAWVFVRTSDGWDAWGATKWQAATRDDDGPLRMGPRVRPVGVGTAPIAPAELGEDCGVLVQLEDGRWTLRRAGLFVEVHSNAPDVDRAIELDAPQELDFVSEVPPGAAWDRKRDELVLFGAGTHPTGAQHAMKVARFKGLSLTKLDERWVGGPKQAVSCTTRPVARFTEQGELYVFHTAGPSDRGEMTLWRTKQIARRDLADGWLVTQLYDEWTRTTVPIAFELGPQGALFAYRWNTGYPPDDMLQVAYDGLGLDAEPMRDFDDGALMSKWGIRHSILTMRR